MINSRPHIRFFTKYLLLIAFFGAIANSANAHEIRPAYLQIQQVEQEKYELLWKIPVLNGRVPKIQPQFPTGFELNLINEEKLADAYIYRYTAKYSASLSGKNISISGLEMSLIDVLVQIDLQDNLSYTLMLQPSKSSTRIPVEPSAGAVFWLYLKLGIEHILLGIDHLLFVLGLLLLVSQLKTLIQTITAFTIAHSITLALSALGAFSLPQQPVEAVIALSIIFLALEYLRSLEGRESLTIQYPWIVAFSFGLLHGFGFAGALSEIGLPQQQIPLALLTFNIGVELGQICFILVLIAIQKIFLSRLKNFPNWTRKILPYAIGSLATFWLIERVLALGW